MDLGFCRAKGQKHSITSNYNFTISHPSTMECIYPVLDVEQLLNVTSVDPSSDGSITFFERMASGKKAQASSKEDSLQTCQIKNQIKHHCGCLRNLINRQPPTKCIKIKKHGGGNSGKNDKPKLAFFSTISTASSECKCWKLLMTTICCFVLV